MRIDLTYDGDGEILTETRYSNLAGTQVVETTSSTYDSDGEVTNILDQDGSGNTLAVFTYTYNLGGLVTSEAGLGVTTTYTYDADDEILSETSSLTKANYSYDADGNQVGPGIVIGPGNQLLSDGTWNYTYDADGNLIEKVGVSGGADSGITWTYTYDNRNQMTSAVETQASTTLESVTYRYDVFGNRIEEDVNNGSGLQISRFAYDGPNIWADLDGFNNLLTRRLYIGPMEAPVARMSNSGTADWYLTDNLGSVRVLTDNTGAVIDEINYDAFGNILTQTQASFSDRYLWTGQQFDAVTGLQFNRARYYDPTIGRWTTEDPLGFAAGDTNLYRYVEDQPTRFIDPSGEHADAYLNGVLEWAKQNGVPVLLEEADFVVIQDGQKLIVSGHGYVDQTAPEWGPRVKALLPQIIEKAKNLGKPIKLIELWSCNPAGAITRYAETLFELVKIRVISYPGYFYNWPNSEGIYRPHFELKPPAPPPSVTPPPNPPGTPPPKPGPAPLPPEPTGTPPPTSGPKPNPGGRAAVGNRISWSPHVSGCRDRRPGRMGGVAQGRQGRGELDGQQSCRADNVHGGQDGKRLTDRRLHRLHLPRPGYRDRRGSRSSSRLHQFLLVIRGSSKSMKMVFTNDPPRST